MMPHLQPGELLEIQRGVARAGSFQGYRPSSVALSGAVGLAAGMTQLLWRPDELGFVALWSLAAVIGFGWNLLCIARTYGASPRHWERSLAFAALIDLSPATLAGLILTVVFTAQHHVQLLPGVWMLLFGTGILASRRHLPGSATLMGGVYLLAGTATLVILQGDALRAEVMAGVFGLGQLVLAWVLSRCES